MTGQKKKGLQPQTQGATAKDSPRRLSARVLPPSLLRGVTGGDSGVQDGINNPSDGPVTVPRG